MKIDDVVYQVLCDSVKARSDDYFLWIKVIELTAPWFDFSEHSFEDVLYNFKKYEIVGFETVSRYRRKNQEKYPELKIAMTVRHRKEKEKIWREEMRA